MLVDLIQAGRCHSIGAQCEALSGPDTAQGAVGSSGRQRLGERLSSSGGRGRQETVAVAAGIPECRDAVRRENSRQAASAEIRDGATGELQSTENGELAGGRRGMP